MQGNQKLKEQGNQKLKQQGNQKLKQKVLLTYLPHFISKIVSK